MRPASARPLEGKIKPKGELALTLTLTLTTLTLTLLLVFFFPFGQVPCPELVLPLPSPPASPNVSHSIVLFLCRLIFFSVVPAWLIHFTREKHGILHECALSRHGVRVQLLRHHAGNQHARLLGPQLARRDVLERRGCVWAVVREGDWHLDDCSDHVTVLGRCRQARTEESLFAPEPPLNAHVHPVRVLHGKGHRSTEDEHLAHQHVDHAGARRRPSAHFELARHA